jgi:glycosyltransferase involved in cell wall biosynthesis
MLRTAALQSAAGDEVAFFGMQDPRNGDHRYAEHFPAPAERDSSSAVAQLRAAGRFVYSREAERGMARVLDAFRPDMVHLHNIYHHLTPSVLRPISRRRVPAVMTVRDFKLVCPTQGLFAHGQPCEACVGRHFHQAALIRCRGGSLAASGLCAVELSLHTALRSYDPVRLFLCPSAFVASKLRAGKVYPDRLRRLPNFVGLERPAASVLSRARIVYVGRLTHLKGVDVLVEAMASLPPSAQLDLAGQGHDQTALALAAERVAPGRVRFHGHLSQEEVADLIRSSSALVLPSRAYENQPRAILEGMAAGVPVVASAHSGIPELVEHETNGLLVEPDDARALADALGRLLADPAAAAEMGRAGRRRAEALFSPGAHLDRLNRLYREAIAQGG